MSADVVSPDGVADVPLGGHRQDVRGHGSRNTPGENHAQADRFVHRKNPRHRPGERRHGQILNRRPPQNHVPAAQNLPDFLHRQDRADAKT